MIIQVDWYKEGGKYYSGGEVTISDDVPSYEPKQVLQAIINEQKLMGAGWHINGNYYVVVSDIVESMADRNYKHFFMCHWKPEQIKALVREGIV